MFDTISDAETRDFDCDEDFCPRFAGKSPARQQRAFALLALVCSQWRQFFCCFKSSAGHRRKHIMKIMATYLNTYTYCGDPFVTVHVKF